MVSLQSYVALLTRLDIAINYPVNSNSDKLYRCSLVCKVRLKSGSGELYGLTDFGPVISYHALSLSYLLRSAQRTEYLQCAGFVHLSSHSKCVGFMEIDLHMLLS